MPDQNETPPVQIPANAAVTDTLAAALRLVTIVATSIPVLLAIIGKHDLIAFIDYLQGADGVAFVGAVTGLGAMAWALWKTRHRAVQAVSVAADPNNPASSLK
jgi:hypothetical protein